MNSRAFIAPALWSLFIFLTLPYAPVITGAITEWINSRFSTDRGYSMIGHAASVVVCIIFLWLIRKGINQSQFRSLMRLAVFIAVAGVYGYLLSTMQIAAEKLHFIEYGFLALLLYRAWMSSGMEPPAIWPVILFSGSAVGALDEWTQHFLPNRKGEFSDIVLNVVSVGLAVILLIIFKSHESDPAKLRPFEHKWIRWTGAFVLLLVGAFLLVTQEYGINIVDPRGYSFNTRMASPEAIVEADKADSVTVLDELAWQTPFNYDKFLLDHPASSEPFVNEFRVHLFRRDRYLGTYAHAMMRAAIAKGDTAIVLSEDAVSFGEAREVERALRSYAAFYSKKWFDDRLGSVVKIDTDSNRELVAWINGGGILWRDLWSYYCELQLQKASASAGKFDSAAKTAAALEDLRVSERENRILEDYFGGLLRASDSRWSPEWTEEARYRLLERADVGNARYSSAVADRIVTSYTRLEVIIIVLFALAILLVAPGIAVKAGFWYSCLAVLVIMLTGILPIAHHPPASPSDDVIARTLPAMSIPFMDIILRPDTAVTDEMDIWPRPWLGRGGRLVDARTGDSAVSLTRFWIGWTRTSSGDRSGDRLLIDFDCEDSNVVSTIKERDSDLWREDAVEIFIDTEGEGRRYVELEISPSNVLYDALVTYRRTIDFRASKAWQSHGIKTATTRSGTGWLVEVSIPFSDLGMTKADLARGIRAGFFRIDVNRPLTRGIPKDPPVYKYQAWAPTYGWFHRPDYFGVVR